MNNGSQGKHNNVYTQLIFGLIYKFIGNRLEIKLISYYNLI